MKILFLYIHILSLAVAIGSMFTVEQLLLSKDRLLGQANRRTIDVASKAIVISLVFLWLTGAGFVALGYLDDPSYIENQKIWAKVLIVFIMTINGMFLHDSILPRLTRDGSTEILINNWQESALMRLSFSVSLAGWLMATFYGIAKFLNTGYSFYELFGLYLFATMVMFMGSYIIGDQKMNSYNSVPLANEV